MGEDFWYVLPDRPSRVGRDGSVWRFFRGRGGKNPRGKPRKVDPLGRVTRCVANVPTEVRVAALVLEAFGSPRLPGHEPQHHPDPDRRNPPLCRAALPGGCRWFAVHPLCEVSVVQFALGDMSVGFGPNNSLHPSRTSFYRKKPTAFHPEYA